MSDTENTEPARPVHARCSSAATEDAVPGDAESSTDERIHAANMQAKRIEEMINASIEVAGRGSVSAVWLQDVVLRELRMLRTWLDDDIANEFS